MSEMLERVARALCQSAGDDPDALAYPPMPPIMARKPHVTYVPTNEHQQPRPCWEWYANEARVAITAMRNPTNDMISAGDMYDVSHFGIQNIFQAMIDAA